jgi:hypothetical protein
MNATPLPLPTQTSGEYLTRQYMNFFHVTTLRALSSILSEGLIPLLGPRSSKLMEPTPAVYMFRGRPAMEDAVCGWLGDEFPPDEPLVVLEVEVPPESVPPPSPLFGEIEAVFVHRIPPQWITSFASV